MIECELLITKIYILALANASFESKNTKYLEGVVFFKKHILFKYVQNFLLHSFFQLLKIIFSDSASKTEYRQVVKSTLTPKIFWWWRFESHQVHYVKVDFVNLSSFFYVSDEVKYFISFNSSYHQSQKYVSRFFSFLSFVEKNRFYWYHSHFRQFLAVFELK